MAETATWLTTDHRPDWGLPDMRGSTATRRLGPGRWEVEVRWPIRH
ncbi:hypothetical protein [Nocardia terpenica]|nr:hypothetical protein [Nocardia terpenica]NQE88992.1 hypothetical protein [Nocardia terpenica]